MTEHSAYVIPFEDVTSFSVVRCHAPDCDLNCAYASEADAAERAARHDEDGS